MKKTFCDCCGDQMSYTDPALVPVSGKAQPVTMRVPGGTIEYEVRLVIEADNDNGGHTDTCADCRWAIIDRLDPRPRAPK